MIKNKQNKNISIIVAIAENNAIGKNNELLWKLSDDLKRFKRITTGHTVIMGRRTFMSLPKGALPDRKNIVISDIPGEKFSNCTMAYSIDEAVSLIDENDESFVIGGGLIYKQFLPKAGKLYLTMIHKNFDADTFFPEIDYEQWEEVSREKPDIAENIELPHTFIVYRKKM